MIPILRRSAPLAVVLLLAGAAPAYAASLHVPTTFADILVIGHAFGSVFGGIGHALLGAFTWTFSLAAKFILVTVGALVKLLIPSSWANQGVQIKTLALPSDQVVWQCTSPLMWFGSTRADGSPQNRASRSSGGRQGRPSAR